MDLEIRHCLIKTQEKNDPVALKKAYAAIKDVVSGKTTSDAKCFLPELCVLCAEQALRLGCKEITEDCLMMYFESKPPPNQFLCRAYFCQAQLNSPSSVCTVEDMDKAVMYYLKAIEISKDNPRYHFLVFNASLLYFQTVRVFLRPGQRQHLVSSLTQVLSALEVVHEPDYAWRAELMLLLVECLVDAGKHKEAAAFAKVTSDFIELHKPEMYPRIFSIQVRHNLIDASKTQKKTSPKLLVIYKMQKLKNMAEVSERTNESAELREIFLLLTQSSQPQSPASHSSSPDLDENSPILLTDRTELLLELAFLSLQLKEHRTAEDCLKELEATDAATVAQCIMMECVECELALKKLNGHIEDYTKSSVEARLAIVGRLDALLQRAMKEGDGHVTQCVCASLWNSCLPLLQNNLRRSIKRPLLTLAHALEDINSMLLNMRCQVHAELAAIEEEEQRLELALKHLHTALGLDENGQYQQHLSSSLHLLQLHTSIYATPTRPEDQAAMLIQQAKEGSGCEPAKKWRPMLVTAGIALAPNSFQMVLDADSAVKVSGSSPQGQGHLEQLAAKAQQHMTCLQRIEGHLASLERGADDRERMRLWASLVKAARKQEAWDVCRTACRFCLLYDDGRWKNKRELMNEVKPVEGKQSDHGVAAGGLNQGGEGDLLRLLSEVHFICAEATIHKLRSEGVELNGSPVLPIEGVACPPEDDPRWALYSDWIRELSAYATANFLRGAELGAEIQESWIMANAAVYLWNYNSHLLAMRGHSTLLATFSRLVELLRQTGHAGEVVLLVLLCDAVAQGIIQPWCETSGQIKQEQDSGKGGMQQQADKAKKGGGKVSEKSGSTHFLTLEAAAVQDIKKALEMCDYALRLSNGNEERVPIMVRKQLISTWVNTKRLLQQQIGQKLDTDDESKDEAVVAMSRVLVGVEMLLCNSNPRLMEFTIPSLGTLAQMASDCKWSDPVVELYVWSQLARFAHQSHDHDLVITCTQNALQLKETAIHKAKVTACSLYSVRTVKEMLSSSACLRGLSMLHKCVGNPASYTAALAMLQSSISLAEQAGSWSLCGSAAKHYWNACLPLLTSPEQRQQLKEPLELIVKALTNTCPQTGTVLLQSMHYFVRSQNKWGRSNTAVFSQKNNCKAEDDLAVRAAMYSVLFNIYTDSGSWKSGLQILDRAIREMPRSPQRLLLYKQRVLAKAKLGESIVLDMQRFKEEGEQACALMWHRVALCVEDTQQQLACYQNAISTLKSASSQRQKVDFLLEFGEWLYCSNFPVVDAQTQIQSAIDILLSATTNMTQSLETSGQPEGVIPVSCLSELREVWRLDGLVRAHTLLAFIESRVTPQHQQYLLLAYSSVLQIWKVSMESAQEVIKEELRNPAVMAPPASAASNKKDKEKEKEKEKGKKSKEPPLVEKKPRGPVSDSFPPSSPEEWAQFECSEEVRQAFRHDSGPYSINRHSISVQSRTLFYLDVLVRELESVSLTPLTLPPLHLAEVIAHDLSLSKSHSDLYRLRIVKTCCDLGLESSSPFRESLLSFAFVPEDEQMACRSRIALQRERNEYESESKISKTDELLPPHSGSTASVGSVSRKRWGWCSVQELWLDKAAVCLSMGLYQPARSLLAEAHLVAKGLGDQTSFARSYHLLAFLVSQEQHHVQALALLKQAEEIGGDEDFWFHLTQSLLNTTAECAGEDMYTQVCQIVDRAIGLLKSALEQRPNRAPVLYFYIASLQAKGAVLCRSTLRPACADRVKTVERLKSVCDTLKHSAAALLQHGYRTPAAETTLEQASSLRMLAMLTSVKEEKQQHLLEALMLMQQAVSLQEEVLSHCLKLLPTHECGRYSLPAMRVCVDFRLALVNLALLMLEMQCEEEMLQARLRSRKSYIERAVEDYILSNTDLSALEQEWLTVTQSLGQMALTQLSVINSLSLDCIETKARSIGMLGRCLRLIALQRDPLYTIPMWDGPVMVENREERKANEDDDEDEEEASMEGVDGSTIQNGESTAKSVELQTNRRAVQQKLAQASETLAQALSLALQHNFPQVLSQVCVDLMECYSQYDPAVCGQYLALLQSCVCCADMSSMLRAACSDTGHSQLAALLGLQKTLQSSPQLLLSAIDHSLHTFSKGYQHLTINPNHLSLLGEMPPNLKILLLQHSEDGSVLYGAFYEKTKATESQKRKSMQIAGGLACSRVAKARVQPSVLFRLRDQVQAFRCLAAQTLLEESRSHIHAMPEEHCTQLDDSTDRELGLHLQAIVKEMDDYLDPVLSQFDFSCFSQRPPSISIGEAARSKDKEERGTADKALPVGSPAEQGECVVVLADRMLLEMPLEALAVLQGDGVSSVSRDFSLQVFHTRLQREQPVESDNKKETKGGKPVKGKGDQSKAIKVVPVNRILPPNTLPVDTHNFKYVVDLHNDGGDCEWSSPAERMRKTLEMYSQQFTPLWDGIIDSEHVCSPAELEPLLANCSSFIFYGTERFLSHISPARLVTLNLTECQMAILFDLVQNNTSMLRQSQQDVQKSKALLALESPLQCVYLLTLCGVHSVMLNQWSSSAKTNAQNMEVIMENLLKEGLSSGQSVDTLRRSSRLTEREVNALSQRVATCPVDVDSVLSWGSPSALNFIIYGLPNLVVT
ncbi:LOW QUALITY PROTEIN: cilia- and flagella-associated protein 46 [Colossoma macropomum]|uniref:LOW QUALITY PROTEIN: cilia- and flagella-associated protein 46 n=1 Tax=Colossoma macropomum TaxID=42526 RepID=UPI0018648917|nr:LOW QUALITY PROTEIN: cilia- and flagella-associated protein 46 [Colossoma macropomum]